MQCNGDMRHVIEILAILTATFVFYKELKAPRVTVISTTSFWLNILNTPFGWALMITIANIAALPTYIYLKRRFEKVLNHLQTEPPDPVRKHVLLKTILVGAFCFWVTYKQ